MDADQKKITELETSFLEPNPLQPRGLITSESLKELLESVKEHGILEPLIVAKTPAGYQIIAGERRWRAAKEAGLKYVPVVVRETTPQGMLEMAIVENVQRTDLNPIERGQAYQRLMEEFGLQNQDISKRVGKSPAFISNSLRLLTLPDALKDGLIAGATTEGHVRALAALDDSRLMIEAYKIVLKEDLSVRGAEDLARKLKDKYNIVKPNSAKSKLYVQSEEIDKMKKTLAQKLNANIKFVRSRVETKLYITLKGSLEKTEDQLQKIYNALVSIN